MAHFRTILAISFIFATICLTTTLGHSSEEPPSPESTEVVGKKVEGGTDAVHSHVKTNSGRLPRPKAPGSTDGSKKLDAASENCAPRHKICRTFGPKPLPCCEGYVCKTTYGEQHCVEPDTKIQ